MKNIVLTAALALLAMGSHAQSTAYVYPATGSRPTVRYGIPAQRTVEGGTLIKPVYLSDNIPLKMRNAFEKACHLWEEVTPTTFPIYIHVDIGKTADPTALAQVTTFYCDILPYRDRVYTKRFQQIYPSEIFSYYGGPTVSFFTEDEADAVIVFNSNLKKFNFELDNTNNDFTQYDFVTVAVQAIGKALGFMLQATYNPSTKILSSKDNSNQFTDKIARDDNPYANFANKVNISSDVKLYYPATYDIRRSLSYFAKDLSNKETLAMQPDVAAQSVVHYIGTGMHEWFRYCDWFIDFTATGIGLESTSINGVNTSDCVPFQGGGNAQNTGKKSFKSFDYDDEIDSIAFLNERMEICSEGDYVLKTDGSWMRYHHYTDLDTMYNESYARTVDGHLRTKHVTSDYTDKKTIKYGLYSYIPRKPDFRLSEATPVDFGLMAAKVKRKAPAKVSNSDNDYYEVSIDFDHVEGCTQILVEQIDADYPVPYTYFVSPSAGSFTTYMNKNYTSTLRLHYINQNGETISAYTPYNLQNLLNNQGPQLNTKMAGGKLLYELSSENVSTESANVGITINSIANGQTFIELSNQPKAGQVDVSSLPNGYYTVTVKADGQSQTAKFAK